MDIRNTQFKHFIALIMSWSVLSTYSSNALAQTYSRVLITNPSTEVFRSLDEIGIDLVCGSSRQLSSSGKLESISLVVSDQELLRIKTQNIEVVTEIPDLKAEFDNRKKSPPLDRSLFTSMPDNFYVNPAELNGGFFTYDQIMTHLDDMYSKYPSLISQKFSIGTTIENRDIYVVKISDNPDQDEDDEIQVYHDAIHHAREPMSVAQLIYYMWYLLENYESDDRIKKILDETEIFFVPVVNVDGYLYNENTDPGGGGFWRKNRRRNRDGSRGVDLNRNYANNWGGPGSSSEEDDSTYRGRSGFSEPETLAIRNFILSKNIKLAISHHSVGSLITYPWTHLSISPFAPDPIMEPLANFMVNSNGFESGLASHVIYPFSGSTVDWMYDEAGIVAFTMETGPGLLNQGQFWPEVEFIIPTAEEMLESNLRLAEAAGVLGIFEENREISYPIRDGVTTNFEFEVQRLGQRDGPLKITPLALQGDIASLCPSATIDGLDLGEKRTLACEFTTGNLGSLEDLVISFEMHNGVRVVDTLFVQAKRPVPVSVEDVEVPNEEVELAVFPNPAATRATLTLKSAKSQFIEIELLDIHGRQSADVFSGYVDLSVTQEFPLDLSTLPRGIYILKIDAETFSKEKLIIAS